MVFHGAEGGAIVAATPAGASCELQPLVTILPDPTTRFLIRYATLPVLTTGQMACCRTGQLINSQHEPTAWLTPVDSCVQLKIDRSV